MLIAVELRAHVKAGNSVGIPEVFDRGFVRLFFHARKRNTFFSHQNVDHLATIVWDANNLKKAAEELKALIRNTLPSEAQMGDSEGGA